MRKTQLNPVALACMVAAVGAADFARCKTRDIAFLYRMGAGFPGDINRHHPVSVEPCKIYTTQPPKLFGGAVLLQSASDAVRQPQTGDTTATSIYGVVARVMPAHDASVSQQGIGAAVPPTSGVLDIVREGYVMSKCVGSPHKGDPVFLWVAADSGSHVQGMFEAAASAGNTAAILNAIFNGPPDSNGNVEIFCFVKQTV